MKLPRAIRRFVVEEDGATMTEYVIMVGFIALVLIVAVQAFGGAVRGLLESPFPVFGSGS